jgi:hypothetical protein
MNPKALSEVQWLRRRRHGGESNNQLQYIEGP